MGSTHRQALGLAIAGVSLTLALAACASGHQTPGTQPPSSSAAPTSARASAARTSVARASVTPGGPDVAVATTGQTLRERADADAAAILRSFAVPPGGRRLTGPPNLPGGVLKTPLTYTGGTWEVHLTGFWEAPGSPQALLGWEQAHLPLRFTLGDADLGPPAWDQEFDLAPEGALISRELIVEVASAGAGQTGIRLDAWVVWQPPRPAGSMIPASATTVTIAAIASGVPARQRLPAPVTISDPAVVRGLAALIDGLPLSTIPPDTPCPFTPGPFLSLTFRARAGGPALAAAETGQSCVSVALTVRGVQQLPLEDEDGLNGRIVELADLSWKLS